MIVIIKVVWDDCDPVMTMIIMNNVMMAMTMFMMIMNTENTIIMMS